jgi:hypothetical protein
MKLISVRALGKIVREVLWNGAKRGEPNFRNKMAGLINHIPKYMQELD